MLNTESPAMESNGDTFLPDLEQTASWSMDQVAPGSLTGGLPEDTDASQEAPNQQVNSTQLGSMEQFQHYQEEQQPPLPPQPPEEAEKPSEPITESVEAQQYNQEAAEKDSTQGK